LFVCLQYKPTSFYFSSFSREGITLI